MNFFLATLAWLVIGAIIGLGIWMVAAKGAVWLLVVSLIAFIVAVGKIGCATH